MRLAARAPGKVNLCLLLGARRPDRRHELFSVLEPVSLADELRLVAAAGERNDEVVCDGIDGENLAARALAAYRELTEWDGPRLRLEIDKRVPVAAGMGGGSSDAAGALRLIALAAGAPLASLTPAEREALAAAAFALGADVPALLEPGPVVVTGAGERVRPLPALPPHAVLVLASRERLSTAEVFAEADRLGCTRDGDELREHAARIDAALASGAFPSAELLVNDLQRPAIALCPAIEPALEQALAAGAEHALVSGSGPTVFGLFRGEDGARRARAAAAALAERDPAPVACEPVTVEWAAARVAEAAS